MRNSGAYTQTDTAQNSSPYGHTNGRGLMVVGGGLTGSASTRREHPFVLLQLTLPFLPVGRRGPRHRQCLLHQLDRLCKISAAGIGPGEDHELTRAAARRVQRDRALNGVDRLAWVATRGVRTPGIDTRLEAVQLDHEIVALGRRGRRERDGFIEVAQRPVAGTQGVEVPSTPQIEKRLGRMKLDRFAVVRRGCVSLIQSVLSLCPAQVSVPIVWLSFEQPCKVGNGVSQARHANPVDPAAITTA